MLARCLEAAGIATILVTMMPFWAEKVGAPRSLAVEFPFAHTLGLPGERDQQLRVIRQALAVLESAAEPGEIIDSDEPWPIPTKEAIQAWQPAEPSPVVEVMAPRIRELLRQRRSARRKGNS